MINVAINKESESMRLDRFLRKRLNKAALSFIFKLIREGKVRVNNKKVKQDYRLRVNDNIEIKISDEDYKRFTIQDKETIVARKTFDILYEDEDIMVVNKPPFLASQPGTGVERNNLVNQIKTYLKDIKTKPALANRLDRGTSGIVVVGKNRKAILALYDLFKNKEVEKCYLTLVKGTFQKKEGKLTSYLKRITEKFQHKMLVLRHNEEGAVTAETSYKVIQESKGYSLLEVKITTGKMHQIRAQLASIDHPVVGDSVYGNKEADEQFKNVLRRQFLHAYKIKFKHPFTDKTVEIEAKFPEDIKQVLKKLGFSYSAG